MTFFVCTDARSFICYFQHSYRLFLMRSTISDAPAIRTPVAVTHLPPPVTPSAASAPPSLELAPVRRGARLLFLLSEVFSFVQWSPYVKSVSKLIKVVKFLNVDFDMQF